MANSPLLKEERETYVLNSDTTNPDIWRVKKKQEKIDFVVVPSKTETKYYLQFSINFLVTLYKVSLISRR